MARANSTAEKIAPQGLTANNLEAFWMPFTANRQFKKAPRMFVARQGHALHHRRRPPGARRHGRPLVRAMPATAARRSSRRSPSRRRARLCAGLPDGPSEGVRAGQRAWSTYCPQGLDHVLLHQLRLGIGRDRAQDRARLSPRPGRGRALPPDRPRARLSRRQFRRHLGRRHRHQPQDVRHAADRRRPHPPHPRPRAGTPSPAASRSMAPSSPTISSASSRCTTPRPSPR